jgi:hypothetical protein
MKTILLLLLLMPVSVAAQSTFFSPFSSGGTPTDPSVIEDMINDGIVPIQPNQYCEILPIKASVTLFGTTIGTLGGLINEVKNNGNIAQGVVLNGSATVTWTYIPCDTGGHVNIVNYLITWKDAVTRVSWNPPIQCQKSDGRCGFNPSCAFSVVPPYGASFTPRCNGGFSNPDYRVFSIHQCGGDGTNPEPGLWGFDDITLCTYDSTGTHSYFCIRTQPTQESLFGHTKLVSPATPVDTPGQCTFNGKTQ